MNRLVMIDVDTFDEKHLDKHLVEIIPEHPVKEMRTAAVVGGKWLVVYMEKISDKMEIYSMNEPAKHLGNIKLPDIGVIGKMEGKYNETEFIYSFSSFTEAGGLYRVMMDDPNFKSETLRTM